MQVIAGLLQYATGNSLGVTLRLCSRACSSMSAGKRPPSSDDYKRLCEWMRGIISSVQPRIIKVALKVKPIVVFKDASWDGEIARWGLWLLTRMMQLDLFSVA